MSSSNDSACSGCRGKEITIVQCITKEEALDRYLRLHTLGVAPAMCQGGNVFRVCHPKNATSLCQSYLVQ